MDRILNCQLEFLADVQVTAWSCHLCHDQNNSPLLQNTPSQNLFFEICLLTAVFHIRSRKNRHTDHGVQAESEHMVSNLQLGPTPIPFGFSKQEWEFLKWRLRSDDELWTYRSPTESWEMLAGRQGICIVRNGRIIHQIITLMN